MTWSAILGLEVVLAPFMSGWVLVGVAAFLGLEVVLAPFMSGWVLVGVAAFLGLEVVGSLHVWVGVGWCGRLLGP